MKLGAPRCSPGWQSEGTLLNEHCRCDGNNPCGNCTTSAVDCLYGSEPLHKAKSDVILETVLRLEDQIAHLSTQLTAHPEPTPAASTPSPSTTVAVRTPSSMTGARQLIFNLQHDKNESLDNAILSAQHTSTTESVLTWPCFDAFPNLHKQYQSIFALEQLRPKYGAEGLAQQLPDQSAEEVHRAVRSFQDTINFSYPTATSEQLANVSNRIIEGNLNDSIEWSQALLIMALGYASQVVQTVDWRNGMVNVDHRWLANSRALAHTYFELYLRQLSNVHLEVSTMATQCLFFTALFFAYLQRPLQAYSYVSMTANKCRLLLAYKSTNTSNDTECLRSIFWSCFILESDYIAELAALPQTGISHIESTVPFPGNVQSAAHDVNDSHSSLYFLACVSMRRLLNRVHDLLYAPETGVAFNDTRFPHVVLELDSQLSSWRAHLPQSFRFTIDTLPTTSQQGGFLRQRYLTCRAVIYRPYLNQVLSRTLTGDSVTETMLDKAQICLDMCLYHILNLRGFSQTVMIDTWICALSCVSPTPHLSPPH